MTIARTRMRQGENDAADPQPWRCVKCGEAVSAIRHDDNRKFSDCACTRAFHVSSDGCRVPGEPRRSCGCQSCRSEFGPPEEEP